MLRKRLKFLSVLSVCLSVGSSGYAVHCSPIPIKRDRIEHVSLGKGTRLFFVGKVRASTKGKLEERSELLFAKKMISTFSKDRIMGNLNVLIDNAYALDGVIYLYKKKVEVVGLPLNISYVCAVEFEGCATLLPYDKEILIELNGSHKSYYLKLEAPCPLYERKPKQEILDEMFRLLPAE